MFYYNNLAIETDKEGYLLNLDDWNKEVAVIIANHENILLQKEHWEIINFVRGFYEDYNTSPAIRLLVKTLKEKFGDSVGNSIYLQRLFPNGPAKQVSKIAGLPKPVKCL